jgi:outer membrane protein assembly factor BamB
MRGRYLLTSLSLLALALVCSRAFAAVVEARGPRQAGVAVPIGDGTILVTAERLGSPLQVGGQEATLVVAKRARGIALWRVATPATPERLAESPRPTAEQSYHFLTPAVVKVAATPAVLDGGRWQLSLEVWVTRPDSPVPPGAPLCQGDGSVVGIAVASDETGTAVVPVGAIRVACFDAGVALNQAATVSTAAHFVANWPFGANVGEEFSRSEADRLEAWREIVGLLPTYYTSLLTSDQLIYLGDRRGEVHCIDSVGRTLTWSQQLDAPVVLPPVVSGEAVYVTVFGLLLEVKDQSVLFRNRHWYASGIGHLYAFNRRTGEILWRHVAGLRGPSVVQGDRVYFGGLNGYGALNAKTGKSVWLKGEGLGAHETPDWYIVGPPAGDTMPVFRVQLRLYEGKDYRTLRVCGEASLLTVDLATGETRQTTKLGKVSPSDHPFATFFAITRGGEAVVFGAGKMVRSCHLPDGKLEWERTLSGALVPGAISAAGQVIVPLDEPSVYSLDPATGEVKWSNTKLKGAPGYLLLQNGSLYLGTLGSDLYALSAQTGTEQWKLECPGGRVSGAPAILGDTLYAAAADGRIYAVAPIAAPPASP